MNDRTAHLIGRTAIVTGAAGGIGEAICTRLAGYGMKLVVTGRNPATLGSLAVRLRDMGAEVQECVGDLSDMAFIESVIRSTCSAFGGIDVVINNAGVSHHCSFEEMTPELFDNVMSVNARAPYFICQKALPELRRSDCATIINISSVVGHKGYVDQSVYSMSKHALLGMSKCLANEVYNDGIRVHVISPGSVYTPMIAIARPDLTCEGMMLPGDIADIVGFYLEMRPTNAVIDEIQAHRVNKEPFA